MDTMKRISKAKTSLILEHPFIGSIALNMPTVLDENVRTACTNGKQIRYNPKFVDELTDEEVKFLVAHECMHPMLEHNFRRNGRQPKKWNQAADYVINQILTDEKIGKFIEGGCLNKSLYDAGKGVSDGIYNLLPDTDGNDGIGGTGDDLEDGEGSPAEREQEAAEWKVRVAQAAQAAKMMGKLSASMERLVGDILTPKVDWRNVLQRFVEKAKSDERTFARPNRRFIQQGLYMPSKTGEIMGELAFAIDCSGSIGQKELDEFATEIMFVKSDCTPTKLHIIYFDSDVCHYDCFGCDDDVVIKPHGGGGTAFSPVFRFMQDRGIDPVACIFLTDLYCDDFGPATDYPVLWVTNGTDKAPWGEVVRM